MAGVKHLRRLIEQAKPGMSVRRICQEGGVSHQKLQHHLSGSKRGKRMPEREVLDDWTRVLETEYPRVLRAFLLAYDYDGAEPTELTTSERDLLDSYRQLDPQQQRLALALVRQVLDQSGQ